MKIRTRLLISFFVIAAAATYFLGNWLVNEIRPRYLETMEETLNDLAGVMASVVEGSLRDDKLRKKDIRLSKALGKVGERGLKAKIYHYTKTGVDLRIYVTNRKGIVLYDSDNGRDEGKDYSRWNDVYLTLRGRYGARSSKDDPRYPDISIKYIAAPIHYKDALVGVITVGKPSHTLTRFIEAARGKVTFAVVLMFVAFIFLMFVVSIWITRPISLLQDYTRRVREGDKIKLPELGKSDIGELGRSFEEMRDALEGRKYVENYVQQLSHELKAPLASLQGASELLQEEMDLDQRRKFLANIHSETIRLHNIAERLQQLSSLESRKSLQEPEVIDLASLIATAIEAVQPIAQRRGLHVKNEASESLTVRGERFLVEQAISNLLQNAVEFSQQGADVSVRLLRSADAITIEVENSGARIPDYAIPRVFERFYSLERPDTGRKSTGLGLSFVREVAALHKGQIHIKNKENSVLASLSIPAS